MWKKISSILVLLILSTSALSQRIPKNQLKYLGAFRLPDASGTPDNVGWEWSNWSSALTYYPQGDPEGPKDGFPGSLFGVGHDHTQYVSEISIPVPVISPQKEVDDLHTARTLQEFQDIKDDLFGYMELPRVGLGYLSPQGLQTTGKLHFAWAPHLEEGATDPSHGWCELDLENPQTAGIWRIGNYVNYVTGDYIFSIPPAWADVYTPDKYLATGRYRDGGQSSMGPTLFAYGPWNQGNPPATGTTLSSTPLLLYGNVYQENPQALNNYHHSDQWSGGVWLTFQDKSAVIFVGTKGEGDCWYGFSDGTVWPNDQNQEGPGERGWWSDSFAGQFLFYDVDDLAAVARGDMQSWEPQPYDTLNIDDCLYHITSARQWYHVGGAACDRERGLLYVIEPLVDNYKSIVHVWQVNSSPTSLKNYTPPCFQLFQNYPNPFNPETKIKFSLLREAKVCLTVFDIQGREIDILVNKYHKPGTHIITWNAAKKGAASGVYIFQLTTENYKNNIKMVYLQ